MKMINQGSSKGVALIVGLIFLIVLTLFVLGSLRDVLLQERMAGSYRNQSLSENAANSLLRNGEGVVFDSIVNSGGSTNIPGATQIDADQAVPPNVVTRQFRTGAGYPLNASAAFAPQFIGTAFQNSSDNASVLSQVGAYAVEGPILVFPNSYSEGGAGGGDIGYSGKSPGLSTGGLGNIGLLETHTAGGNSTNGQPGGSSIGSLKMFRITARATGGTGDFVNAAESYYLVTQ
jgi:Tfp pilus assembly protein PilX